MKSLASRSVRTVAVGDPFSRARSRGVTLAEVMVVALIVGLLASLIVPATITRSLQAKIALARAETKALAEGEETVGMIFGFYVPLQMLDDIGVTALFPALPTDDTIQNEPAGLRLINATSTANFQFLFGQPKLADAVGSARIANLRDKWEGPYVQPARVFVSRQFLDTAILDDEDRLFRSRRDFALDPWGNPYRLYSAIGIVANGCGEADLNEPNDSALRGAITPCGIATNPLITEIDTDLWSSGLLTDVDDRFDRFAVVSFGPDGISDGAAEISVPDASGSTQFGDDIIHFFGTVTIPVETGFRE